MFLFAVDKTWSCLTIWQKEDAADLNNLVKRKLFFFISDTAVILSGCNYITQYADSYYSATYAIP